MTDSHFPASKSTIMVVDDEPELADIVRLMLKGKEFNVRCAFSGLQFLTGLEKQKPDLILLDVMMPEMSGLEVLRRLRGTPETSTIPVILLTVLDRYEDVLTGYEMGADYYLTKPFTKTQLMMGINRVLSRDQATL